MNAIHRKPSMQPAPRTPARAPAAAPQRTLQLAADRLELSGAATRLHLDPINREAASTLRQLSAPPERPRLAVGPMKVALDPVVQHTTLSTDVNQVKVQVEAEGYLVGLVVAKDGRVDCNTVKKGDRDVTALMGEALLQRLRENPAVWGSLTALAAAAVGAIAHEQARSSGRAISLGVLGGDLLHTDHYTLRVAGQAELSGTQDVLRVSEVSCGQSVRLEGVTAAATVVYRPAETVWTTSAEVTYQVKQTEQMKVQAHYTPTDGSCGALMKYTLRW